MTDIQEISNIFEGDDFNPDFTQYRHKEWQWIPDINNGSYNAGRVNFDTLHLLNSWIIWRNSYLQLNLRVQASQVGGSRPYTADSDVSLRNCVTSLIRGMLIQCNDITVSQPNDVNLMAQIRNMIEMSPDYVENMGSTIHMSPDNTTIPLADWNANAAAVSTGEVLGTNKTDIDNKTNVVVGGGASATAVGQTYAQLAAVYTVGGRQVQVRPNKAAVAYAQTNTASSTASAFFVVDENGDEVPLILSPDTAVVLNGGTLFGANPDINEIAAGLRSARPVKPLSGNNLTTPKNKGFEDRIRYTRMRSFKTDHFEYSVEIPLRLLSKLFDGLDSPVSNCRWRISFNIADASIQPFCVGSNVPAGYEVDISPDTLLRGQQRLYYENVSFKGELFDTVNKMLKSPSGMVKRVQYLDHKIYKFHNQGSLTEQINLQITPGLRNVVRLFILPIARVNTTGGADATVRALTTQRSVGYFAQAALDQVNILVDNQPYYAQNIDNDRVFYQLLQDEFFNSGDDDQSGSLLSYEAFTNYYRYYCFNLSRSPDVDVSKPVSLYLRATRATTGVAGSLVHSTVTDTREIDLYCLVEYEAEFQLNISTSAVYSSQQ